MKQTSWQAARKAQAYRAGDLCLMSKYNISMHMTTKKKQQALSKKKQGSN